MNNTKKGGFYMLVLERKGNEVFYNGERLKINTQASKGEGNEAVYIEGLEGSNGQKWISLNKLKEGINEIECKGRVISKDYELTKEEQEEIAQYQAKIDTIIQNAKNRYFKMPNLNKVKIENLSDEQKLQMIEQLQKLLNK